MVVAVVVDEAIQTKREKQLRWRRAADTRWQCVSGFGFQLEPRIGRQQPRGLHLKFVRPSTSTYRDKQRAPSILPLNERSSKVTCTWPAIGRKVFRFLWRAGQRVMGKFYMTPARHAQRTLKISILSSEKVSLTFYLSPNWYSVLNISILQFERRDLSHNVFLAHILAPSAICRAFFGLPELLASHCGSRCGFPAHFVEIAGLTLPAIFSLVGDVGIAVSVCWRWTQGFVRDWLVWETSLTLVKRIGKKRKKTASSLRSRWPLGTVSRFFLCLALDCHTHTHK